MNYFVCPTDTRSAKVVGGWERYPTEKTILRIWLAYYVRHRPLEAARILVKWPEVDAEDEWQAIGPEEVCAAALSFAV
jgi:hypothetical protein